MRKKLRGIWRACIDLPRRHFVEALESRTLLTNVTLVKDINTGTASSYPTPVAVIGSILYFTASQSTGGGLLYRTDGTLPNTSLVSGFQGRISGKEVGVNLNGKLIYANYQLSGNYIATTDSTGFGTSTLKQLNSNNELDGTYHYYAEQLTVAGNDAYFTVGGATNGSANGTLWLTDGTAAGTQTIAQLTGNSALSGQATIAALGNKLLFTNNLTDVWLTDGTAAGTTHITGGFTNIATVMTTFDNKVFFYASTATQAGLWSCDGTPGGTTLVYSTNFSNPQAPIVAGSNLYFAATDPANAAYSALVVYSSTTHTATEVRGTFTPYGANSAPFFDVAMPSGKVLFQAASGAQAGVWASGGTAANTIFLSSMPSATGYFIYDPAISAALFQGVAAGNDLQNLYSSDGTVSGTQLIRSVPYAGLSPTHLINYLGKVFFQGMDPAHGVELWSSDGSTAGTNMVFDLNVSPGSSDPTNFGTDGTKVYFDAADGATGIQPWVSDGTAAGTHLIAPIDINGAAISLNYVSIPGKTFFEASANGFTNYLYETDGTTAGTALFSPPGLTVGFTSYTNFNNLLYFTASDATHGSELFKSDGTAAGTSLAVDVNPGAGSSSPGGFITYNGQLAFSATNSSGQQQVYISDGTAAHTTPLTSFTAASLPLRYATVFNGKLYFIANITSGAGTGMQLWQTNGTVAGTSLVKQITTFTGRVQLVATATALYFIASDPNGFNSTVLYKSDGTTAGTTLVTTFASGTGPSNLLTVNGKVFFEEIYQGYRQLFITNGTALGTTVIGNFQLQSITTAGTNVYFVSYDPVTGNQSLWRSDGTTPGTLKAADLSYAPGEIFTAFGLGNILYLSANDGVHGTELMSINLNDTFNGTTAAENITLVQDADHTHIDWSTSTTSGKTLIASPGGLTLNGGGVNVDTITLLSTNGNPLPNILHLDGLFTINGLSGLNPLLNTDLEIGNSTIYITYAGAAADPLASVRGYLRNGYNAGLWNGTQTATTGAITSATAAGNTLQNTAIGYADSADGSGVNTLANSIELKYTLYGDTTLTGTVGFADFSKLTQTYGNTSGGTWDTGDWNYDGSVDFADFSLLTRTYGTALAAQVPTPGVAPSPTLATSIDQPATPTIVLTVDSAKPKRERIKCARNEKARMT